MKSFKKGASSADLTYLRESTVVPNISMVREAVANITKPALLDILLDGIEWLLLRDLHLSVGPARNFDDHVEDTVRDISVERDVVERGNN